MASDTQILFGLILLSVFGMIAVVVGRLAEYYAKKITGKQAIGMLIYVVFALSFYLWIFFYWLDLYSESLE